MSDGETQVVVAVDGFWSQSRGHFPARLQLPFGKNGIFRQSNGFFEGALKGDKNETVGEKGIGGRDASHRIL